MSTAAPSISGAAFNAQTSRRRIYAGLTLILLLIALAVVISVVFPLLSGQVPNWRTVVTSWIWVPEVLIIIATIGVILWMSRTLQGGDAEARYERRRERRFDRRHGVEPASSPDSAVVIARERFARGEISKEQLDQIVRQLGEGPGSLPPT